MDRIKRDVDDKDNNTNRLNYTRVSIIKAYLLRKARIQNNDNLKEVLSVGLNEKTTKVEYLLGRLFAVLEKAQQDTNPDLNKTIKDRYFSSASATPAVIFPILLKLTQHYIAKSEYKYIAEKRIGEIMNQINEFPSYLTLEKQGIFALGYYHQRVALFQKSNKKEEE
jgi:CRISPR-associated protein Csd1